MADEKPPSEGQEPPPAKSVAEINKDAVERFNVLLAESLAREKKLNQHYEWRGNRVAPFSIEPMPFERQRLASPMTAEDRALRKEWIMDQRLAPNEPKFIPEVYPRNIFRQVFSAPWDRLAKSMSGTLGPAATGKLRYFLPRLCMSIAVVYGSYYHLKYNPAQWTGRQGWHIYGNRPRIVPEDPEWKNPPVKVYTDFNSKGFTDRKVYVDNIKTCYTTGEEPISANEVDGEVAEAEAEVAAE